MEDLSVALGAARAALMQGDKTTARAAVAAVLRADPGNAQAWLLMSGIVSTPEQQRDCLARVLAIEPANAAARRGLAALDAAAGPASPPPIFAPPPAPAAAVPAVRPLAARPAAPWQPAAASPDARWQSTQALPAPAQPPPAFVGPAANAYPAPAWQAGPAVPDLTSPFYDPTLSVAQRGPARGGGKVPTFVIVLGVIAAVFIGVCLFAALLFKDVDTTPPPTPKISAQDRTVGMMNELLVHYSNPAFFQRGHLKNLARPVIQKYIRPSRVERILSTLEDDMLDNEDAEMLALQASMLKQSYIANPQFRVVAETEERITLEVIGGDQWFILRDGRELSRPLRHVMRRIELENIDGVWYIDDVDL